jgi:thymidylate synthase ThyX
VPDELKKTKLLPAFLKTINLQNQTYQKFTTDSPCTNRQTQCSLGENVSFNLYNLNDRCGGAREDKGKKKILSIRSENSVIPIEDARYVTSLAMATQLGATFNARNLELVIRRFAASDLSEVRKIGRKLFDLAVKVAPSIILFYEPTEYDEKTYYNLGELHHRDTETQRENKGEQCKLVDFTSSSDDKIIASIIHRVSNMSYAKAMKKVQKMSYARKLEYIKKAFQYAKLYDVTLREFEHCYLTFEAIVSAACFGQLKRHRLATITPQDYDLNLGVTIPDSIKQGKQTDLFNKVIAETEKTYNKIYKDLPHIASYILTQAHRRRVLLTVNVRELYHIARLRMDKTAQWDIRELTTEMVKQARKVMPLSILFCGAKDQYLSQMGTDNESHG